ncbi:MAG: LytR/AlgR family response regulator transcription factor [Gammaproteobacteria bacterium]
MRWHLLLITLAGIVALSLLQPSGPNPFLNFDGDEIQVCAATQVTLTPPTPGTIPCETRSTDAFRLYRSMAWISGDIDVPQSLIDGPTPVGFIWNAKAASRVFVNGQLVGSNGMPGPSRASEQPGTLDHIFYLPKTWLKAGNNSVTVLASSQHRWWPDRSPLLVANFAPYRAMPHHRRHEYQIALLTFGAFIVGAVYFSTIARFAIRRPRSLTLSAACGFAAAQLLAEVSRGVWAYPYPLHDLRMVLVSVLSFAVGMALLCHTQDRFEQARPAMWRAAVTVITAVGLVAIPGFESKAIFGILIPLIAAGLISVSAAPAFGQARVAYTATFCVFVALILLDPGNFLDQYYYLALVSLLICLFVQQAIWHNEALIRFEQADVARQRLAAIIEQAQPVEAAIIEVKDRGTLHRVPADTIAWCCSAGDYVALHLMDGKTLIHSQTLVALEKSLPAQFLRVHRANIVNTQCIAKLSRKASGTGALHLHNGDTVPVSRRIMPSVRQQLGD